jgi:hypothetical protein
VCSDAVLKPVPDGPQVQVLGLDVPEVPFKLRQVLAGGHGAGRVEGAGGDGSADDVDPVCGGLGVDAVLVAAPGDPAFADVQDEVLGDLPLIDDLPGGGADLVRVLDPPGGGPCGYGAQVRLGGGQQLAAGAGALGGLERVPAGDQPPGK